MRNAEIVYTDSLVENSQHPKVQHIYDIESNRQMRLLYTAEQGDGLLYTDKQRGRLLYTDDQRAGLSNLFRRNLCRREVFRMQTYRGEMTSLF